MEISTQNYTTLDIPQSPGVYILHLELPRSQFLQIGKLGKFQFSTGQYLYVGSALNRGGLKARLGRHLLGSQNRHWHIDWLRPFTSVKGLFYTAAGTRYECLWSQFLIQMLGGHIPVPGFGASDCRNRPARCAAHLVFFMRGLDGNMLRNKLPNYHGSPVVYLELPIHFHQIGVT